MKETFFALILVVVLLIGVVAGAYFLFFHVVDPAEEPEPPEWTKATAETTEPTTAQSPTDETTEPITNEPTEEPTEEPTQAQPELNESSSVFIVNGVRMETFTDDSETELVEASAYFKALGLDAEGTAHETDKARVTVSKEEVTVDAKRYDTVYNGAVYVPIYEVAELLGYPTWVDDEYGGIYITPACREFEIPANVNVPVLMYHAVSDDCWGYEELFVSPSDMEEQLKYLVDNGYDPIWFEDLAHAEDYDKPVILTFDDGYDDNYTELLPLLQKYNVKATVFVIGQDFVDIAHKMNEEQIRAMSDSGLVSIQSHTYTHGDLSQMDEETLQYEMNQTNKVIARITGKVPYVLCYPSGDYSSLTIDVAKEHYLFGLKMVGGLYNTSVDGPFEVSRYYIARSTDIYTFSSYISSAG